MSFVIHVTIREHKPGMMDNSIVDTPSAPYTTVNMQGNAAVL